MPSDFDDMFAARVAPYLMPLEEARRHQAIRLRRRALAFGGLCLAWLGTALWVGHVVLWSAAPVLAAVGLFIGLQVRSAPGRDYDEALRTIVLPPLCEAAGGWRHERAGGRDVFSRDGVRVEPSWALFALPDWSTPILPVARADADRLLGMLATAPAPAYAATGRETATEPEAQVTP
ncbi:hypothetical protein [Skermanella pratensis]|uniref:hypothetical protein n=1 Tax=Skermanella pratensis TaxID=2233999 RepID=UPI0013019794|nr:hypothetical protein [Skermanella pratensis]